MDARLSEKSKEKLLKQATCASMGVAFVLIVAKFFAWSMSRALSLEAALLDGVLDAVTSFAAFLAVRNALEPADKEHRFGHGKLEAIAALGQSLFVGVSALWLLYEAFQSLKNPRPLKGDIFSISVIVFALLCIFFLVKFQRHVIKKTDSPAIRADSAHYESDFFVHVSVLASLVINSFFKVGWFDTLVGACIGGYILRTAWTILLEAFHILMDHELPDSIRERLQQIALAADSRILGIHDLRTRRSGMTYFVQMHIELDEKMRLEESHEVASLIEARVCEEFPHAELLIHQDPRGIIERRDHFEE